jgi:hypothetical protein
MNSYVIYKIIKSQKARPKYLGFQHFSLKKDTLNNNNNNKNLDQVRLKNPSTCSLEPSPSLLTTSTPSLLSAESIDLNSKNSKGSKSIFECFFNLKRKRAHQNSRMESIHMKKNSLNVSSRKNSTNDRYQGLQKMQKENNMYSQLVAYSSHDASNMHKGSCRSSFHHHRHSSSRSFSKNLLRITAHAKNLKKMSVNRISHYITIIILGFYFILSTIPYGVMLTFQNNLTLKLNYFLEPEEIYQDKLWLRYGNYRQLVACTKLFFISNHCLNFFVYFLFNRMFRHIFIKSIISMFSFCKYFYLKIKMSGNDSIYENCNNNNNKQILQHRNSNNNVRIFSNRERVSSMF